MGSEPRTGSRPAMPGPVRLVRRSVLAGARNGHSRAEVAMAILGIVNLCRRWLSPDDDCFTWWLDQLAAEARKLAQVSPSPDTSRPEGIHGDTRATAAQGRPGPGGRQA